MRHWYSGSCCLGIVLAVGLLFESRVRAWEAAVPAAIVAAPAQQAGDTIVVRGCVERDAAASATVYKLITTTPSGVQQYRLTASGTIAIAPHVGHTVEVTGTIGASTPPPRGGHAEPEILVKKLTLIANAC